MGSPVLAHERQCSPVWQSRADPRSGDVVHAVLGNPQTSRRLAWKRSLNVSNMNWIEFGIKPLDLQIKPLNSLIKPLDLQIKPLNSLIKPLDS
jgi:hypothetical protein